MREFWRECEEHLKDTGYYHPVMVAFLLGRHQPLGSAPALGTRNRIQKTALAAVCSEGKWSGR